MAAPESVARPGARPGAHPGARAGAIAARPAPRPLSVVLAGLALVPHERISLADAMAALADRGYAALLILFAAPNLLPLPPGSSTLLGLPLILVAGQLLLGRPRVWLPAALGRRSLDRETVGRLVRRGTPLLGRLEFLARPRLWPRTALLADRLVGALALAMALVLVLPIPFGNLLPALAVLFAALALAERDGLWLAAGLATGLTALAAIAGVAGSLGLAAAWLAS